MQEEIPVILNRHARSAPHAFVPDELARFSSKDAKAFAGLVKAGLIERQADPDDGRASILVPTASGVAELEKHFANRGRALEPLMADWSDADREHFLRLLSRFTGTLESRRDDVARAMAEMHSASRSADTSPVHPQ